MRTRRRFVMVAPSTEGAHALSVAALEMTLVSALGQAVQNAAPSLEGWPTLNWSNADCAVCCEAWRSSARPERRLATVTLIARAAPQWEIELRLAATAQDELLVCEETRVPIGGALSQAPDLFAHLADAGCRSGDGLPSGVVQRVDRLSVGRFADFVHAPERTLPVVLLSPTDGGAFLVDRHALARALLGMAHVVVLNPHFAWPISSTPLQNHPCFGGAIRVYQTEYADGQTAGVHRYWKPAEIAESPARAFAALVDYVADLSSRGAWRHPDFAQLENERTAQIQDARIAEAVAQIRAPIERRANGDISAAEQLVDELNLKLQWSEAQQQGVEEENKRLRTENWNLKTQVRQLKEAQTQDEAPPEDVGICHVMISRQAQAGRGRIDRGLQPELLRWLQRLRNPEARAASSDVIDGGGGLHVYPRSDAADGMRIIWYDGHPNLRICEIFRSHALYERERNRGLHVENYTEFADVTGEIT